MVGGFPMSETAIGSKYFDPFQQVRVVLLKLLHAGKFESHVDVGLAASTMGM